MIKRIIDISSLSFGVHLPGTLEGALYLQGKNFNDEGEYIDDSACFVEAPSYRLLLQTNDILLLGKGSRNFAWQYNPEIGAAVASGVFYIIRPNLKLVSSEYLTSYLNSAPAQNHFKKSAKGTGIFSIRKPELGALEVPVLPFAEQQKIVDITNLHKQQLQIRKQLIALQEQHYASLMQNIVQKSIHYN